MKNGVVKGFNESKRLGFIEPDAVDDLFTRFSESKADGFKSVAGLCVNYETKRGPEGLMAANIQPL